MGERRLSEQVSDEILEMITIRKRFVQGQKLPNENELAAELGVSRMTLREAIRILAAYGVLEIRRGVGTFVAENEDLNENFGLDSLSAVRTNLKDLMEMRLIFEPEAAYYAAMRASEKELEQIEQYARQDAEMVLANVDRTEVEKAFHNAIAKASHNEFMHRLMPIINSAVYKVVILSNYTPEVNLQSNIDHKNVVDFLKIRDADGARTAMRLHILHVMEGFGIERD
jgi:GntR family transcriptional repressor for pyruvate dehydrogenase complex